MLCDFFYVYNSIVVLYFYTVYLIHYFILCMCFYMCFLAFKTLKDCLQYAISNITLIVTFVADDN